MSSSSSEFRAPEAINVADLETLVAQIKLANSKYQNKSSMFSSKPHADTLGNILTQASSALKSINDEYLTRNAMSGSDNQRMQIEASMAVKTKDAYMDIVKKLEEKFDLGLDSWEKGKKKYITEDMHDATRYDMYNCAHLNAEQGDHSSSRNIGLILQSSYVRLGDQEKIKRMQNLQSTKDSLPVTAAPAQAQPALRIVNQHDLNFAVAELQRMLAEYRAKGSGKHEKDIINILEVAEEQLFAIGSAEKRLDTNPSMTHDEKVKALRPQVTHAFNEIVKALQTQFDAGIQKWAGNNKKMVRNEMSPTTKSDMYNCLHLNAETKDHSASRNIGMLLKSLYGKLDDREKMDCMRHLKSDVENQAQRASNKM